MNILSTRSILLVLSMCALAAACVDGESADTHAVDLHEGWIEQVEDVDLPQWEGPGDLAWKVEGRELIFSSPRVFDVDGDGVGDIVLGHGVEFNQDGIPVGYVTARSGVDGHELWRTEARDEVVGSAALLHIDDDDVLDLVIGGRNAELMALSGASGELLWQFYPEGEAREDGWYNFYSAQVIADLDGDGTDDIVAANGGDARAIKFTEQPPGNLVLLSGASGEILGSASTPDDQPTYMSPILLRDGASPTQTRVLFGSGGESLPGSLWIATIADILAGDLSSARALITPTITKGIIAPPTLADLNNDGALDIVANFFDGRTVAIDGVNLEELWSVSFEGVETYASPSIGNFNTDDVPDVFCAWSMGAWPTYRGSQFALIDGASGEMTFFLAREDITLMSTPLVTDLTGDGIDEIIFIGSTRFRYSQLIIFDPTDPGGMRRVTYFLGGGLASPWIGDLEGDGTLDMVLSHSTLAREWTIERWDFDLPADLPITYGAYLGTNLDGESLVR